MEYCSRILYPPTKFDITIDSLISIKHLMCGSDFIFPEFAVDAAATAAALPPVMQQPIVKKSTIFLPTQENTLFWCMFISKYGLFEYEMIGSRYLNAELDEKQKMVDYLLKVPEKLKASSEKLSKQAIQELAGDLMVEKRDAFSTMIGFSVFYGMDIYVVFPHNKTYLLFSQKNECCDKHVILYAKQVGKRNNWIFSVETDLSFSLSDIVDVYYQIDSYKKSIKGQSAYKVDELREIANKVGIEIPDKIKKSELYEKLAEHLAIKSD